MRSASAARTAAPGENFAPGRFFDRERKTFPGATGPATAPDGTRCAQVHTNFAGGYHALGELFSKTLRRPPVRRFWPRGADSCRRGERPPGTGPAGVGDGGFDPADHRGSEGGSVPFLRAETSSQPVLIPDGEELVGGKQNRIVNASIIILQASDRHPGVLHGGGQVELQPADAGQAVFRAAAGETEGESRQASMRKEATERPGRSGVK